jgi:hypothetical protein
MLSNMPLFSKIFVIVRTFIEPAFLAGFDFNGKSSLHLSSAQRADYLGTMSPMKRICWTLAQIRRVESTALSTTIIKFPAIHSASPYSIKIHSKYHIGLFGKNI